MHIFGYLAYKVKMLKFPKGQNSRKKFQIFFQKLIRSSTHYPLSSFKAIVSTFLDTLLIRLKCQNIKRAVNKKKKNKIKLF